MTETNSNSKDNPNPEEPDSEQKNGNRRYLGIFLASVAGFFFSLSALIIKKINYPPYSLGVWRFTCIIIITIPFLIQGQFCRSVGIFNQILPLNKTTALLFLQAVLGSNSIMLVFHSLEYLNIGDSIVIGTSAPVFVALVAYIFLKERCGIISMVTAVLALVGVVILCKPPILTGSSQINGETLKGVLFSTGSMILLTFVYVLIRYLRKVHHALVQFSFAVWGLFESVVMVTILNELRIPADNFEGTLLVVNAVLAFTAQTFITLALKYEQAGVVALVRTSEVIFAYFWQILFFHVQPDLFSVIGAVITFSCVVIAALRTMLMDLPDDHNYKKKFGFLLF